MPDNIEPDVGTEVETGAVGNTLTIRFNARDVGVPLATFLDALQAPLRILNDIDSSMQEGRASLDWRIISASYNSPLTLTLVGFRKGTDRNPGPVARALVEGFTTLERGGEPPEFTDQALTNSKRLMRAIERDGIASVEFGCPGLPTITPTQNLVRSVEAALRSRYYYEYSEIGGILESIDIHNSYYFVVYGTIDNHPTKCYFKESDLELAKEAIGKRVYVEGKIKFNRASLPVSMTVEALRRLRPPESYPEFKNVGKVNLTGDLSPEEYIRRLRDEE